MAEPTRPRWPATKTRESVLKAMRSSARSARAEGIIRPTFVDTLPKPGLTCPRPTAEDGARMVLDWMAKGKAAGLPDLIARKQFGKAVEMAQAQLRDRPRDGRLRLQLA